MKVLKDKATPEDSSDFIKEVQNMIELESKQHCQYIIKLRGVAKSMLNFTCRVTLDKHSLQCTESLCFLCLADGCRWPNCLIGLALGRGRGGGGRGRE